MENDPCKLCDTPAKVIDGDAWPGVKQRCPQCGEFKLDRAGIMIIRRLPRADKAKLSGWVRDQNILGEIPQLSDNKIRQLLASPMPGISDRADRLLSYVIRRQNKLGGTLTVIDPALVAVTYSRDQDELKFLIQHLLDVDLIKHTGQGGIIKITPAGHMHYEKLQALQPASAQGFVAMWFDETMRDAYFYGFEVGIRNAGYDPLRVDQVEHVGKIDDEIISQIRRSRFVVADFTGQRGGVYFEAGFALGLNLPVVWTCHQEDIDKLHFDTRQFNCIDWTEPPELAERLQKRIEAVIGAGPRKPLPL